MNFKKKTFLNLFSFLTISGMSFNAIAQLGDTESFWDGTVRGNGGLIFSIPIMGSGTWACASENVLVKIPTIARGYSMKMAKAAAITECSILSNGDASLCQIKECELDKSGVEVKSDMFAVVTRSNDNISVNIEQGSKFVCLTNAWSRRYSARALTRTEAKALVRRVCLDDEAKRGTPAAANFFCVVENNDCEVDAASVTGPANAKGLVKQVLSDPK